MNPTTSEISFAQSGDRPTARYVSDTTVCEEALEHGRLIRLYWSASGQVERDSVSAALPGVSSLVMPLHVFDLEIDGQALHNRWEWVAGTQRPGKRGTREGVVELRHQIKPITLKVVTRLDGSPILARYLEITNTGATALPLSRIAPWAGLLWNTLTREGRENANPSFDPRRQSKYAVGYFHAPTWGGEGDFRWQALPPESFSVERNHKESQHSWPYYVVKNEVTGELFFLGIAWSGNTQVQFSFRDNSLLLFRAGVLGPAPLRVIAPGETVTSPEIHLGPLHGPFDAAVGHWHRHVRTSVLPPRPQGREMYTAAGHVVEEPGEWILREVDCAAAMGLEAFMVDAGWYGATFSHWKECRGDWQEGSWLPGGMAGVRDYVQKKGMLFGLWHEPETLAPGSRTAQKHRDWIMTTDQGRVLEQALNLSHPAAAKFFEESVLHVIRDFKLDYYKLDFNIDLQEGGQNVRDGWLENEFWRHCETLYRTYDRVLKEFPGVCLENCASGGGRNDLGMLARFHYCCESDWSVHPNAIRTINAMTLFIPPEAIAYYHNINQGAHHRADLQTHLRVTLFVTPIFAEFGAQDAARETAYFREMRRYIALHKGFCRPVLANQPVVFHHTPDIGVNTPAEWCVLEYAARDASRGYAGIFKLDGARSEYCFRPRGIDPAQTYEVTMDNRGKTFLVSGRDLELHGLTVALDTALTSELVLYSQIAGQP